MRVIAFLGISDATLGAVLAIAWLVVLTVTIHRYSTGTGSRARLYAVISMGLIWLSYSLLQISTAVAGLAEIAIVGSAVVLFGIGIVAGVRCWRMGRAELDTGSTV